MEGRKLLRKFDLFPDPSRWFRLEMCFLLKWPVNADNQQSSGSTSKTVIGGFLRLAVDTVKASIESYQKLVAKHGQSSFGTYPSAPRSFKDTRCGSRHQIEWCSVRRGVTIPQSMRTSYLAVRTSFGSLSSGQNCGGVS